MPFSVLNGRLPDALLVHLGWPEADYLRLRIDAADSLDRLAVAFEAHHGRPLRLTDAYRTYASQVELKARKGKWAATPGTSNHGLGIAIDMASNINRDGSDEHQWMEQNGPAFGWINPAWAEDWNPANGQHEPWHWEYDNDRDTHPAPEDDDMPLTNAEIDRIASKAADAVWAKVIQRGGMTASAASFLGDTRVLAGRLDAVKAGVLSLLTGRTATTGGAIDYALLAEAVNDDAARRMAD